MGKYDKEEKPLLGKNFKIIVIGMLLLFMFGVLLTSLGGSSEKSDRCKEMKKMMLEDPNHTQLHDDYPIVMQDLHEYLDDKCIAINENELVTPDFEEDLDSKYEINIKGGS